MLMIIIRTPKTSITTKVMFPTKKTSTKTSIAKKAISRIITNIKSLKIINTKETISIMSLAIRIAIKLRPLIITKIIINSKGRHGQNKIIIRISMNTINSKHCLFNLLKIKFRKLLKYLKLNSQYNKLKTKVLNNKI